MFGDFLNVQPDNYDTKNHYNRDEQKCNNDSESNVFKHFLVFVRGICRCLLRCN